MNKLTAIILILFFSPVVALSQAQKVVRVTPGFATVIVCPAPPDLVTVGKMDAFSIQTAGNYVLIKPVADKGVTNMFIKAGAESFNLLLQIADSPDLEVRLAPSLPPAPPNNQSLEHKGEVNWENAAELRRRPLADLSPKALAALSSLFKSTNRYTYSVNNSKIIFAIDHMKQIGNKLFVIGTIINNSNIPYDVGFVQFKLLEYARSYIFWRKKLKETEMEPSNEYFNSTIKPHTSGRLLFIFDKHGFSHQSTLYIKCNEENGRRELELEVPGKIIE